MDPHGRRHLFVLTVSRPPRFHDDEVELRELRTAEEGVMRGFQLMSPERRREVAGMGGRAAQARGSAHWWTSAEAQAAGEKGARHLHMGRRARAVRQALADFRESPGEPPSDRGDRSS
jgi:hypothetical protein